MADRPILFSAPMVRALLDGRKTVTRRVLREQPAPGIRAVSVLRHRHDASGTTLRVHEWRSLHDAYLGDVRVPIAMGDRLWVRERIERANGEAVGYPADRTWLPNTPWLWERSALPSIHMPRRLSRLTLNVTWVQVERLQEITEEQAEAEGVSAFVQASQEPGSWSGLSDEDRRWIVRGMYGDARRAFAHLWSSINGAASWDANPWVAAYTFSVEHRNIDAPGVPDGR